MRGQRSNQLSYVPRVTLENLLHAADGLEFNLIGHAANRFDGGKPSCTLASATSLSVSEKRRFHATPGSRISPQQVLHPPQFKKPALLRRRWSTLPQ